MVPAISSSCPVDSVIVIPPRLAEKDSTPVPISEVSVARMATTISSAKVPTAEVTPAATIWRWKPR